MAYHSLVSDMGAALSSGQRQRILLARALYRDPDALFLDEGTANLDAETENEIARHAVDPADHPGGDRAPARAGRDGRHRAQDGGRPADRWSATAAPELVRDFTRRR